MKEWRVGGAGSGPEPESAPYDWQVAPGGPWRMCSGVQTTLDYLSEDKGPRAHVGYVCDVTLARIPIGQRKERCSVWRAGNCTQHKAYLIRAAATVVTDRADKLPWCFYLSVIGGGAVSSQGVRTGLRQARDSRAFVWNVCPRC